MGGYSKSFRCFIAMTLKQSKNVLIICMLDSIHSARWLESYKDEDINFYLFPSTPNRKVHQKILDLTSADSDQNAKYHISYWNYLSIFLWLLDIFLKDNLRGFIVGNLIKKRSFRVVHAIELNHAGYILNKAHKFANLKEIKKIVTSWGSDIYWFRRYPKHKQELSQLLRNSDEFISECRRDHQLATELGFKGKFWHPTPVTGGFAEDFLAKEQSLPSSRKYILVKGYESFVGRASIALSAISALNAELTEYEIKVYSANLKTKSLVRKLQKETNLTIDVFGKKKLSHDQMLQLFENSRIYLGVSLSDGISVSLLESMATGAFPIQTNTSCGNEWVKNGESAFLVEPELESIKTALLKALKSNELVDVAMDINRKTAKERLNQSFIHEKLRFLYS